MLEFRRREANITNWLVRSSRTRTQEIEDIFRSGELRLLWKLDRSKSEILLNPPGTLRLSESSAYDARLGGRE